MVVFDAIFKGKIFVAVRTLVSPIDLFVDALSAVGVPTFGNVRIFEDVEADVALCKPPHDVVDTNFKAIFITLLLEQSWLLDFFYHLINFVYFIYRDSSG